jgi:hypothetical protein
MALPRPGREGGKAGSMWLPLVAILLAGAYFWAARRGALGRLGSFPRGGRTSRARRPDRTGGKPELVDRLKVFQDFLEDLPQSDEESDPPPPASSRKK